MRVFFSFDCGNYQQVNNVCVCVCVCVCVVYTVSTDVRIIYSVDQGIQYIQVGWKFLLRALESLSGDERGVTQ